MMLPDFNRLRVFFHVHAAGSVSEAARELGVTQSAVSQSLAKLEAELGAPLFVRRHRRLVPTPAADELQRIVAPFVDGLREGVERIHRERHELVGELRLGAPVEFGSHRLPPALASFREHNPGVRFALTLGHPSEVVPLLEEGRLDVVFADRYEGDRAEHAGLEVLGVMEEALVMVAAPAYEARVLEGSRAFTRIQAASFVAYQARAPALRGWFRHHFGRGPGRLELALVVQSVPAVIEAVEHGLGLGLVPEHAVEDRLARGSLVRVRTRRRELTNQVALLRLLDKVPSRSERALVRHLLATVGA
ncbi:MAG: LysR family transcriptional regulator [Myxococcales bacterium]|nr:LysR family transcriptional regulator [Myxococcales bacterium]